ncbi:MAG TPA: hypothetical protein VK801_02955 [Caulobacteraceae bacterium]|jgi:hypothetical protein|nr:hypothetical protein [Caulobacteraceae bacterium]
MFRAAGIAVIALGFGLSHARAAEPSLFETYKSICFDTRADPQKALAVLEPGWSDAPVPKPAPDTRQFHKVKKVGAEHWELLLIEHDFPPGADKTPFAKRMHVCMLYTSARASALKASVAAMMGAPPNQRPQGGGVAWSYFDQAEAREYYSGGKTEETNARLAKAPLVFVMVGETPQGEVVGFTEVEKLEK